MRQDVLAAIGAGVVGLIWVVAIWVSLVFGLQPPLAPAAAAGAAPQKLTGESITLVMTEWGFGGAERGGPTIEIRAGEEVEITLINEGVNFHSFQVVTKEGVKVAGLDEDDVIGSGETRVVRIRIDQPGEYIYICPVAGHEEKGMAATLIVVAP